MKTLLELFLTFARIGLFTFGGGYAMIPLIEDICVERRRWITHDEMMDITVIAESTPGPIAINCSTFVGYRQGGLAGAAAATVGVALPSFCVILLIAGFMDRFLEIAWIASAFRGIKLAVGILIVDAALRMLRKLGGKPLARAIAVCACLAMLGIDLLALRVSTIALMLAAAGVSLAVYLAGRARRKGGAGG